MEARVADWLEGAAAPASEADLAAAGSAVETEVAGAVVPEAEEGFEAVQVGYRVVRSEEAATVAEVVADSEVAETAEEEGWAAAEAAAALPARAVADWVEEEMVEGTGS